MIFWKRLIVKLTTNEHRVSQIINIEKVWSPIVLLISVLLEGLLYDSVFYFYAAHQIHLTSLHVRWIGG